MCNGANLAYEKQLFYQVDGFTGIDTIASGDDMLLMNKVAEKYPQQLGFVKSASCYCNNIACCKLESLFSATHPLGQQGSTLQTAWHTNGIAAGVFHQSYYF